MNENYLERLVESSRWGESIKRQKTIYIPVFTDENGNEIEEHFPYTTDIIFLLSSITEEKAKGLYVEEKQQIIKTPPFISGVFFCLLA